MHTMGKDTILAESRYRRSLPRSHPYSSPPLRGQFYKVDMQVGYSHDCLLSSPIGSTDIHWSSSWHQWCDSKSHSAPFHGTQPQHLPRDRASKQIETRATAFVLVHRNTKETSTFIKRPCCIFGCKRIRKTWNSTCQQCRCQNKQNYKQHIKLIPMAEVQSEVLKHWVKQSVIFVAEESLK